MSIIKKILTVLFCTATIHSVITAHAGMQICYDGAVHWYDGSIYSLYVNGSKIDTAMEPIIFNNRALVPVREIFEKCGATVRYNGEAQSVEVQYGSVYIRLYINDNTAYVNGKPTAIPDGVVPKLIYKPGGETKTMVPVRFISETAGMEVEFDGATGSINITSAGMPTNPPKNSTEEGGNFVWDDNTQNEVASTTQPTAETTPEPVVKAKNVVKISNKLISDTEMTVTVQCDGEVNDLYSYFTLNDPERVVTDFAGMNFAEGTENIEIKGKGIKAIRTGVNDEKTRVVIDVENLKSYKVTQTSDDTVEVYVSVTGETKSETTNDTSKNNNSNSYVSNKVNEAVYSGATGIVKATEVDSKKVIMLDAGHGGSDPGAQGNLNGTTIDEKDLTLSITYKVKSILESNGYKTSMTRTGDTLPSLSERPAQANSEGCALFVSIHINSAEAESAHGTEVYWSEQNNGSTYGVTSEQFAENVINPMLKYMESYDRGVKMANWAVIRRSQMPAILVEVGFISNTDELENMVDDNYQDKVATGIAEGIINTIHKVEIP